MELRPKITPVLELKVKELETFQQETTTAEQGLPSRSRE